jgi:hypothetical protein
VRGVFNSNSDDQLDIYASALTSGNSHIRIDAGAVRKDFFTREHLLWMV